MSRILELPYGPVPLRVNLGPEVQAELIAPAPPGRPRALADTLDAALDRPINALRLDHAVSPTARVLVIVSDATRDEPREAMLRAVLARIPSTTSLTVAIANGTHGPTNLPHRDAKICHPIGINEDYWKHLVGRARVVDHDAFDEDAHVTLGVSRRGTRLRVNRCVAEADWVISTGRIKPHYFAGYSAGIKGIFPGLGANAEIRVNHALKQLPGARPGVVDGNPCREDMEEIAALLPGRPYVLNVVMDEDGGTHAAVAGDPIAAFRAGAAVCRGLYLAEGAQAPVVLVSDHLPLTASLYQASKLVAGCAPLLEDGGTIILAAACPDGVGGVETVNRAIYEIGIKPRLPTRHRVVLVSSLSPEVVGQTYCAYAPSVEEALARTGASRVAVVPRAGSLIVSAREPGGA